jgi:hypothetical protein
MLKTRMENWMLAAALAAAGLGAGCDGKQLSIEDFGTTDLVYDGAKMVDPRENLPRLAPTGEDAGPGQGEEELPDAGAALVGVGEASHQVGGGDAGALAEALRQRGMVRQAGGQGRELMAEALESVSGSAGEMGVLVTSDALLNTFHNFFDNMLLGLELRTLRPRALAMLDALRSEAAKRYNSLDSGPTRDAALDVVAYLQVAESLMDPGTEIIAEVEGRVDGELALITLHEGLAMSPTFDRPGLSTGICASCDACKSECHDKEEEQPGITACGITFPAEFVPCAERYCEDYSQYVPRGHYTYNEELSAYFRSVMWLGRMAFLQRSAASTRGAIVLLDSIKSAQVEIDGETVPAQDIWRQFWRAVGTFVGSMDDLNITEIDVAVRAALGNEFSLADLDDDGKVAEVQEAVGALRDPEILSGFLSGLAKAGEATKGLRLFGQAFLPDSYALGRLVYANVGPSGKAPSWPQAAAACGIPASTDVESLSPQEAYAICGYAFSRGLWDVCRGMPSGLDVAAMLGSPTASALAHGKWDSYAHYGAQLDGVASEIAGYDLDRWGMSLAWTWLYALSGMLAAPDPRLPAFMRTEAWQTKTLETSLASWAEMRHDTILYAKQSYTNGADAGSDGGPGVPELSFDLLEPQPAAYARLASAARRLGELAAMDGLFDGDAAALAGSLEDLATLLTEAKVISAAELQGAGVSESDGWWIRGVGARIEWLENGLLESLGLFDENEKPDPDRLKTTIVADVHTFPSKEVVLEAGSGYLDTVAVIHRLPSGEWGVAVGPALSYHEFEHEMGDRLTDEKWRSILAGEPRHGHPSWLDD